MDEFGSKVVGIIVAAIAIFALQALGVHKLVANIFGGITGATVEEYSYDKRTETELAFWKSTEKCGTPDCYKLYLNKYPYGEFASLAHNKVGAVNLKTRNTPINEPSSPVYYKGVRGVYFVDYELGQYQSCLEKGSIILGKEKRVGYSSWENGRYLYSVNEGGVVVYKDKEVFFRDIFKSKLSASEFDIASCIEFKPKGNSKSGSFDITYKGDHGIYTIDSKLGTYQACTTKGYLFLGKNKKVGKSSWRNGHYLYTIESKSLKVYKGEKVFFEDKLNKTISAYNMSDCKYK